MIKTTAMLLDEWSQYACPANKLARMVKSGVYTPIVKGLYETDKTTPGYLLAGSIYGPSYLSFDFALAQYGLIPEAVYAFTSATFEKKKQKRYDTPFGRYTYRDVPSAVFPLAVRLVAEGSYIYRMASPEKALCDKLYTLSPAANQKALQTLLFEDLRLDRQAVFLLDTQVLGWLCPLYHTRNLKLLGNYIRRWEHGHDTGTNAGKI